MNEQAKEDLRTAVTCGPSECCALARLAVMRGSPNNLTEVAQEVGFTQSEAFGIMDGWDAATRGNESYIGLYSCDAAQKYAEHASSDHTSKLLGKVVWEVCGRYVNAAEYTAGRQLGKEMYELASR